MLLDISTQECQTILRNLEIEAYSSIVSAFRAQGDLNERKYNFLIELQSLLKISIERHKAELRRAANDEKLFTVAKRLSSDEQVSNEWIRCSTRLIPLLATESTDCLLYKSNDIGINQEKLNITLTASQISTSHKKSENGNETVQVLTETSKECLDMKRKVNKNNRSLTNLLNKIKEEMATFEEETKRDQAKQPELRENKLKEETSEPENSSFIEKLLKKHKTYLKEKIKRDEHEAQLTRNKFSAETYQADVLDDAESNKPHHQSQLFQPTTSQTSVNNELKHVTPDEIKLISAHPMTNTTPTSIVQNKNISTIINPSTSTSNLLNSNYTFNGSSMVIKLASPRVNTNNTLVNGSVLNLVGANRPVVRPLVNTFTNLNQKVILVQNNNSLSSAKVSTTPTLPINPISHINLANTTIKSLNIQSFDQQQHQQQQKTLFPINITNTTIATKPNQIVDLNLSANK